MKQNDTTPAVSPISLDGRFVRLRPISRADYNFLWQCRCHPEVLLSWMQGRTLPSFDQYVRELETSLAHQVVSLMLIETADGQHPIGSVVGYDYSSYDRYAFFGIALTPPYGDLVWGAEATLLFLDYLFTYLDLRKVCMDINDFNPYPLAALLRRGARQEGRFHEHRYYQGTYRDVIRLALTQAEWAQARGVVAQMLTPQPSEHPEAPDRHPDSPGIEMPASLQPDQTTQTAIRDEPEALLDRTDDQTYSSARHRSSRNGHHKMPPATAS